MDVNICIVCHKPFKRTHGRQKMHRDCRGEHHRAYMRQYWLDHSPRPPAPFVPKSFDEAMERGRAFYRAGLKHAPYPDAGFAVSSGDLASYALGVRHSVEFPNG